VRGWARGCVGVGEPLGSFVACPRFGPSGAPRQTQNGTFWWFYSGAPDKLCIWVSRSVPDAGWGSFVPVVDYEVFLGVSTQMRIHGVCLACLLEPRLAVVFYGCRSMSLPLACSLFSGGSTCHLVCCRARNRATSFSLAERSHHKHLTWLRMSFGCEKHV
jgi:hypothetical protein